MSIADELADVIRIDRRSELVLDLNQERRDRREQNADRPCWNCGGSGVRCCEFGADTGASDLGQARRDRHDERVPAAQERRTHNAEHRRAVRDLYGTRTGNVTPAPLDPPDLAA